MLLITADVVARNVFGTPIQGVVEVVKLSIIAMTWAMAAQTLRSGGQLRSNILLRIMPQWLKSGVLILNCLAGALLMTIVCWLGSKEAAEVFVLGTYEGAPPTEIVIWPSWFFLTLGSGLTAIQYLMDAWRILRWGPSALDDAGELDELNEGTP